MQSSTWMRWFIIACVVLFAIVLTRWTFFRSSQPESEISRRQYQAPEGESHQPDSPSVQEQSPLAPVLEMARQLKQGMDERVANYTAKVIKRERIKGKLGNEDTMHVKIRHESPNSDPPIPFSVYLTYVSPSSSAGREVIWVQGQNNDKLLTYQFGLNLSLPTDGLLAMMGNKYPITDLGMLNLAEKLIEKGQRDINQLDCKVDIFEDQLVDDRLCKLIQVTHPKPLPGLDYHLAQIFIDNELELPIRYAAYLWPEKEGEPPQLEEEYTYLNLQLNVGLTDEDFDPKNAAYNFPK